MAQVNLPGREAGQWQHCRHIARRLSMSRRAGEGAVLEGGEQYVRSGQRGAVGGLEGFDGLDAGAEGVLLGESWNQHFKCAEYL